MTDAGMEWEFRARERELADQIAWLRAKGLKRRELIKELRLELSQARENIGELNSMLVRKDEVLQGVRRAHENQALTIGELQTELNSQVRRADQWREAHKGALAVADGFKVQVNELLGRVEELQEDPLAESLAAQSERIRELERQLDELREDEPCDCAPNLALAACKKKLGELEGMLEVQRRNTRELGVNLQRVRDEKTGLRVDLVQLRGDLAKSRRELDTANELARQYQTQRDQAYKERLDTVRLLENRNAELVDLQSHLSEAADLDKRKDRAVVLLRRATNILDPEVQVTGIESTFNQGDGSDWDITPLSTRPQAKKAEPRPRRCSSIETGSLADHDCKLPYSHSMLHGHQCHCGEAWR